MRKILTKVIANKYCILIIIFFLIGVFLRFYRLEEFATFLGDQGRDALIIKRILTLEHFPAIGAPSSMGMVYLGPFYYYFIAPWLLLFNYQPVGLAFGVAFFSSLYIIINYLTIKELFNQKMAIISSILIALSTTLIGFSRYSWNPNLLPLFTLLTIYFLVKSLKTNRWFFFIITGSFLSFSIQLHYLALFLIPPMVLLFIYKIIKNHARIKIVKQIFLGSLLTGFSFMLFSLPLLIFDLRHDFLNTNNFIKLLQNPDNVVANKLINLLNSFFYLNQYSFSTEINHFFLSIILIFIIASFVLLIKQGNNLSIFLLFFITILISISLINGPKPPHYLAMLYPLYFVIIAYFLSLLTINWLGFILLGIFLLVFILFNAKNYYFISGKGGQQIQHAKIVATFLNKIIDNNKFNFAVQPDDWQEDTYLYFLELMGKRPVDRHKLEISDQMYVVCGKPCSLYSTRSWNVNMFGRFRIENSWFVDNVNIFKLIHQ